MTLFKLTLPDKLAREAESAGLLKPHAIQRLLREEIRRRRINKMFDTADRLAGLDAPPLSTAEVETEIQAARAKKRTAHARRR